jgi:hypothetical protein
MNTELEAAYLAVLAQLAISGPKALMRRVEVAADELGIDASLDELVAHLLGQTPNDPLRKQISLQLALWDAAPSDAAWTQGTNERSEGRRTLIYELLDFPEATRATLLQMFPVKVDQNVIISEEFDPWYTDERRQAGAFYWPAYQNYLRDFRGWQPESIADLGSATTDVVQRLSDPSRTEAYQSKGLVVGYVQSGKTANFTGVLAKAIDSGYRLLIVMTGTIDILREQTQRRVDMELVGEENILRDIDRSDAEVLSSVDYQDDPDWIDGRFIRHGVLPSSQNFPDIIRLTNHRFAGKTGDYRSLQAGITALEFEKFDRSLPLHHPVNLPRSSARLVIIKKNTSVLKRLVRDLKTIRPKLGEIPALVIDDESDQASVNTSDPSRWQANERERSATNKLIAELLGLLPRSQYVGYTATPFANVFIDPSDTEDIFPKDFLLSLGRPPGYMGVSDFHDLDSDIELADRTVANSREKAHVRDLLATGPDRIPEMQHALAAFVISGAIKLYRESLGSGTYRHHTMLVHESVKQDDHKDLADEIRAAWSGAAFSSPSGLVLLRNLFEGDFTPVSAAQEALPFPATFDELKPFIGRSISKITGSGDPIIIVNGDKDLAQEAIDFDKRSVWRILVGGTKLSRGFTVEGLTISYYRRKTKQADTLMQMGRWFGFRHGYRDLVRLYIGRAEADGRKTIDLYEAFEAIVRDEERFRDELRKYAELVDGRPQIRPSQIPPLVSQHLPWLRPAARNKMFNARLVTRRSPGTPVEPVALPKLPVDIEHNYSALLPLMASTTVQASFPIPSSTAGSRFDCWYGLVGHDTVIQALRGLRWVTDGYFAADLRYFEELGGKVDDWVVLMPQLGTRGMMRELPGVGSRSLFKRSRTRDPLFQAISDPKYRDVGLRIANATDSFGDSLVEQLRQDRRGSIIVYPIVEDDLSPAVSNDEIPTNACILGLTLVAPASATPSGTPLVQFEAYNKALAQQAIIPRVSGVS